MVLVEVNLIFYIENQGITIKFNHLLMLDAPCIFLPNKFLNFVQQFKKHNHEFI